MTADRRLNATSAALLGLLHDGPLTGWELIGRAQERIGEFWSLTPSQIYRELTGMADRGLVSAGPTEGLSCPQPSRGAVR